MSPVAPIGPAAPPPARDPAATARAFEGVLLGQMVADMLPDDAGPFGGGQAEAIWRDTLARRLGDALAARGGIGLAAPVEAAIRRLDAPK